MWPVRTADTWLCAAHGCRATPSEPNLREVAELIRRLVEKRERRVWEIGVEVPA